jgi:hypothetical protein
MKDIKPTIDRVRELFRYEPDTGLFYWRVDRNNGIKAGTQTLRLSKRKNKQPRALLFFDMQEFKAQDVAWAYINGEWPNGVVRPKNGITTDLRISNLYVEKRLSGDPTPEDIRRLFNYDAVTGVVSRAVATRKHPEGRPLLPHKKKYKSVVVGSKVYRLHVIAWVHYHGKWPEGFLDHANGDKSDNRIANLREASPAENLMNAIRPIGVSGFRGVFRSDVKGKWVARINKDNTTYHLGQFKSLEEAKMARIKKEQELYGEFSTTYRRRSKNAV